MSGGIYYGLAQFNLGEQAKKEQAAAAAEAAGEDNAPTEESGLLPKKD